MTLDWNIGIPTKQNLARPVEIQNLNTILDAIAAARLSLDLVETELGKIKSGTGFVTGVDLDNV